MANTNYIGPEGGDWFNPANWSNGVVPAPGDVVDIEDFYSTTPDGPNATAAPVTGVAINLTERNPSSPGPTAFGYGNEISFGLHDPQFNLVAGQLGSDAAPVSLNSTNVTQGPFTYNDDSIVSFQTLTGSLSLGDVDFLTVAAASGGSGVTVDGNVTMGLEAGLNFTSYTGAASGPVLATPVTINGRITTGGDSSYVTIYSDDLTGTGAVDITAGGILQVAQDNLAAPAVETLAVDFSGNGGRFEASGLRAGYGGTISGFAAGDSIYGSSIAGDPLVTSYAAGALTVTDAADGQKQSFTFAGNYAGSGFQITPDGSVYEITYGPTDAYTGPAGGNWFDNANWSAGAVTPADVLARLYGPAGADATSGTVTNATVDVSGTFTDAATGPDRALIDPNFNLTAGQVGTASAATDIEVTGNSGTVANAGITLTDLYGNIEVTDGQKLTLGVSEEGLTLNSLGALTVDPGAELDLVAYGPTAFAPAVTELTADVSGTLYLGVDAADIASGQSFVSLEPDGTLIVANPDPQGDTIGVFFPNSLPSSTATAPLVTLDVTANAGGYAGTIFDFGETQGDRIILDRAGTAAPIVTFANGVLTIAEPGATGADAVQTFTFSGDYSLANFDVSALSADTLAITYNPCFATGTLIDTADGPRLVEALRIGEQVRLADGGFSAISWIGHRRQRDGDVVRVRPRALGPGAPTRDLVVSTDHGLFLDGVLVPAGLLVDGETITLEHRDDVTFWHVELDRHAVLLAEGAAAESYFDSGNRRQFANCPLVYNPIDAASAEPCAEMVFAGERLDALRAKLGASRPASIQGFAPDPLRTNPKA